MKLDVLSAFPSLRIATAYSSLGETYEEFPRQQRVLYNCSPVYEDLPAWESDVSDVRSFSKLPKAARRYIERIEELAGIPVTIVSVGAQRSATFFRN